MQWQKLEGGAEDEDNDMELNKLLKNKWLNGIIYPCRKIGTYPQIYVERSIRGKYKAIDVGIFEVRGQTGITLTLTTRMARLLGKRIQEALKVK